jgi:hypothetical protein
MKAEIERAVAPLVGLPRWGPARESNMLALQFGERQPAPTRADPGREVGAYTLQVYCAWRLTRADALVAGSADLFTPADPDEDLETFDYEAPGATWWDVRWKGYVDGAASAPTVMAIAADAFGGLRMTLSDGAALEVFPNSAPAEHFETEFWNLVRGGRAEPEVRVGTAGVERGDAGGDAGAGSRS